MDTSVGAWQQQLMTNLINDCHLRDFKEWNKLRVNRIVSFEVAAIQRAAAPGRHRGWNA